MDDHGLDPEPRGPLRMDGRRVAALGAAVLAVVVVAGLVVHGLSGGTSAASGTPRPSSSAGTVPGGGPAVVPSGAPSGSPEPPYTGPTLFGVSVPVGPQATVGTVSAVVARIKQEYGGLPVARIFSNDPPPATWSADPSLAGLGPGTSVVYSFKADPDRVVAGAFDAQIRSFLGTRPAGVRVWFVYYHEPEDDIAKGVFTKEQFVAATAHLAPVVRAAGGYPTTILMQYTLAPKSGRHWQDYYSPAIDVLAWDAYNNAARGETPSYKPAASFVNPVLAVAKQTGKPFGWGEFGSPCISTDPGCTGRAAWLDSVSAAFRTAGAQFATYWNRAALKGTTDYSLTDPDSMQTYRKFVTAG